MTQNLEGIYSRQVEKKQPGWLNIKTLNVFLIIFIVAGGLYYVIGINDLVVKGFKLEELKAKSGTLAEQNRKLKVETTSLKSYNNLAKRIDNLSMVAVEGVDYIKVQGGVAVAK
jgi:hypothetical protein